MKFIKMLLTISVALAIDCWVVSFFWPEPEKPAEPVQAMIQPFEPSTKPTCYYDGQGRVLHGTNCRPGAY